jgi:hypothetical protein
MSMTIRTYSELMQFRTIEERFEYLALRAGVGDSTFGFERYINQQFYRSRQWKQVRYEVIARDLARDLAVEGYEIHGRLVIHHMNPMGVDDIADGDSSILDPEFLITTAHRTHNAIHYGDANLLRRPLVERRPGDTKLW